MIYILTILFAIVIAIIFNIQFSFFTPASKKLRILEYHSISNYGFEDQITISKDKIIEQFEFLKKNNYKTLWLSEIEEYERLNKSLPPKSIVLTFDDGFLDTYTELYPLLKYYDFKAVCFLVLGRIGKKIDWSDRYINSETILMNTKQIKIAATHIEYGYHTYKHDNYTKLSFEEIDNDLKKCQEVINQEELIVYPALAYTFGRYFRKKDHNQKKFFQLLHENNIKYAFRIGNRINKFPFSKPYEIQRIDIRGIDSIRVFKRKVILGRNKLF